MKRLGWFALVLTGAQLVFALRAHGAKTLDELLEQTRTAREQERKENADRERQFQANRDQQAALLAQAEAQRKAAEAQSQQLSAQYDAFDKEINNLDTLLKERAGNLGELFGVTRQVAGDTATVLSQSMISAQFPDREEFLRGLAGSKELPGSPQLERLWFEMQREMTESGRVARIHTKVVEAGGTTQQADVVRVGPFIAMSGGRFLMYLPGQKTLAVLSRQPPSQLTRAAAELQDAKSGYVRAPVDPSRGVLLGLYVERPNVWERIQRGQFVGYVIITVGVIGALAAIYQFFYLLAVRRGVKRQLANIEQPSTHNPLGRVLAAFKGDASRIEEDAEVAELRISEAVLREVPRLERFQAFLRLAVAAGPLLGLIGTVIGMIITFQSITESGSSDPKLMAAGIGQAMIATVLGLGIAIPLLFINTGLAAMSRQIVQILDEQSTGLLAESIERKKKGRHVA
ncbi:MAG TPA: MotA/TolQ/ExbB proton channel family protein [Candidatus Binatia bacterium]|nr:MotA/TolQ/ExbB proton channel family protein [Candidatus Binatia bacterium]